MMPVLQSPAPKRSNGFSIDSLISRDTNTTTTTTRSSPSPRGRSRSPPSLDAMATHREAQHQHHHHQQQQQQQRLAAAMGMTGGSSHPLVGSMAPGMPHPAFWGHTGAGTVLSPSEIPPSAVHHPHMDSATLAHLFAHGVPPSALGAAGSIPGTGGPQGFSFGPGMSPHGHIPQHLLGMAQKDNFPFYTWLLSRHGNLLNRGLTGMEAAYLFPFRKPKRIRTAFSPSQLLRLEHAFEKNHYVVGQERKDLAATLNLTETQVKVWFQNRRTKYKRVATDDGSDPSALDEECPESDCEDIDVDSPPSPNPYMANSFNAGSESDSGDEHPHPAKMARLGSGSEHKDALYDVMRMSRGYPYPSTTETTSAMPNGNVHFDSISRMVPWNIDKNENEAKAGHIHIKTENHEGHHDQVPGSASSSSQLSADSANSKSRIANKRPWESTSPSKQSSATVTTPTQLENAYSHRNSDHRDNLLARTTAY